MGLSLLTCGSKPETRKNNLSVAAVFEIYQHNSTLYRFLSPKFGTKDQRQSPLRPYFHIEQWFDTFLAKIQLKYTISPGMSDLMNRRQARQQDPRDAPNQTFFPPRFFPKRRNLNQILSHELRRHSLFISLLPREFHQIWVLLDVSRNSVFRVPTISHAAPFDLLLFPRLISELSIET